MAGRGRGNKSEQGSMHDQIGNTGATMKENTSESNGGRLAMVQLVMMMIMLVLGVINRYVIVIKPCCVTTAKGGRPTI